MRRISPSQLQVWNHCEQEWHYSYVEGLKPISKNIRSFEKGLYFHRLMHVYYQLQQATKKKFGDPFLMNSMLDYINKDSVTEDNIEIMSVIWPILSKYISFQSPQIDAGIEVIGVEYEYKVNFQDIILHGIIDLLYRDTMGRLRIRDHKSSEQKNSWNQDKVKMHHQLMHNALAMSIEFGEPVYGVEINFVNTYPYKPKNAPPTSELFKVFKFDHNDKAIESFGKNLIKTNNRMSLLDPIRNYNKDCNYCAYFQLCHMGDRGSDMTLYKKSAYRVDETVVNVVSSSS